MSEQEYQIGETEMTGKILEHLDAKGIPYEKLEHEVVTTSEAAAGARASRLEEGAKALVMKAGDTFYHLIISAAKRVDNNKFRKLIDDAGLHATGVYAAKNLVEVVELRDHPFFIAVQFHPEFKSRPESPHPLFRQFISAAIQRSVMGPAASERLPRSHSHV